MCESAHQALEPPRHANAEPRAERFVVDKADDIDAFSRGRECGWTSHAELVLARPSDLVGGSTAVPNRERDPLTVHAPGGIGKGTVTSERDAEVVAERGVDGNVRGIDERDDG